MGECRRPFADRLFDVLALALLGVVLLVAWEVVARNTDIGDTAWIEDVCRLLQLLVGMLFIAAVQRDGDHIAAQFLRPASSRGRRMLVAVRHAAFLVIGIAWAWLGTVVTVREAGMVGAGGLQMPLPLVNGVIPLAGLLVAWNALVGLRRLDRDEDPHAAGESSLRAAESE